MSESKKSKSPTFQQPRILTDGESNLIRGKILAGDASKAEILQLVSHFDLVDLKLRSALETLRGCFDDKLYVFGSDGELWSNCEPGDRDFTTIDFAELLDGLESA